MKIKPVLLVMVDISGYTKFINYHRTSVLHAEEIISELLETVIDVAEYPLQLNKLEGDAAFMFTEITGEPSAVAADVFGQVQRFFNAFKRKQQLLITHGEGGCPCDACTNIHRLDLKAFIHSGQAVFKRIRQFEELAGEDVILIHRLLKNNVPANEYILITEAAWQLAGHTFNTEPETRVEAYDWLGEVTVQVIYPQQVTLVLPAAKPATKVSGMLEATRLYIASLWHKVRPQRQFAGVPRYSREAGQN